MPRMVKQLTDMECRRFGPGKYSVGGAPGLMLRITPSGARSWVLRVVVAGRRRDMGLGGYPEIALAQARQRAREVRDTIWRGTDPIADRKLKRSAIVADQARAITFAQVAEEYVNKKSREFKTAKQRQKLENQLAYYALPTIGNLVVGDITRAHVVAILLPIWETKNETASRVRLHVERVLDLAGAKGLRTGDNPARWTGNLELSFPARAKVGKVTHYAALPVGDTSAFITKLADCDTMAAKALHFAILTAARSQEVREATWGEIDADNALWVIPAERMKTGKRHTVPLTPDALAVLESTPRLGEYLFTNTRGGPLTDAVLSKLPKIIGHAVTAHGMRATFRTWAQEFTNTPEEVVELCLAHVNSDATRTAYARSELIDKRRVLMQKWADYCRGGAPAGEVVPIRGRA